MGKDIISYFLTIFDLQMLASADRGVHWEVLVDYNYEILRTIIYVTSCVLTAEIIR